MYIIEAVIALQENNPLNCGSLTAVSLRECKYYFPKIIGFL